MTEQNNKSDSHTEKIYFIHYVLRQNGLSRKEVILQITNEQPAPKFSWNLKRQVKLHRRI